MSSPEVKPVFKWWWAGILLSILIVFLSAALLVRRSGAEAEPEYGGLTLRSWIAVVRNPKSTLGERQAADAAIKAMGTNVIPGIINSFDRPDESRLGRVYRLLRMKAPGHIQWSDDWTIRSLHWVDPAIRPVVTEAVFAAYLDQREVGGSDQTKLMRYAMALHGFEDASQDFIASKLTNSVPAARAGAASLVGAVGKPSLDHIPALGALVADQDVNVRFCALAALTRYSDGNHPGDAISNVVAHLCRGLDSAEPHIRWIAAQGLARFGGQAETAIPALVRFAQEEYSYSNIVVDAIGSINPEAAARIREGGQGHQ